MDIKRCREIEVSIEIMREGRDRDRGGREGGGKRETDGDREVSTDGGVSFERGERDRLMRERDRGGGMERSREARERDLNIYVEIEREGK